MPVELVVPSVGESVTEVEIGSWNRCEGERVAKDEALVVIETDKATMEIFAPEAGVLSKILVQKGTRVNVGQVIGLLDTGTPDEPPRMPDESPAGAARSTSAASGETVPMSLIRRKIAERLVEAQNTMALLTTFNEVDLSGVLALRREFQDRFRARHGVKLGLMSFFVKAVVEGLREVRVLNAEARGSDIVYHRACDIGVAIGGGRGLVVPVLRGAERLSFAEIELAIADFAVRVKGDKIRPDDLVGGTFTITNGGIYGSLLSTPLINPPQSGVLGMHAIQDRPVALQGQVVIRPMMYVALTYDHRLVDGREAVTFLRRVKEQVESPGQMLSGI